jgi:hypothetical protein
MIILSGKHVKCLALLKTYTCISNIYEEFKFVPLPRMLEWS